MTPLKCTVAVKGMTGFKEVRTKEAQKELGESVQREKKSVKCAYASKTINYVQCAQIKVLGLRLANTYTPIEYHESHCSHWIIMES